MDDVVEVCGDYRLYTHALRVSPANNWQAWVLISLEDITGQRGMMRSRSFSGVPLIFNNEADATAYALQYGRMLIASGSSELQGL